MSWDYQAEAEAFVRDYLASKDAEKELAPEPPPEPKWITRLREDRDTLLAAAKRVIVTRVDEGDPLLLSKDLYDANDAIDQLQAAIAKAEEQAP